MLKGLIFVPFVFQAIAIFFDEFHLHRKRRLPLWERIGHPIDTISVVGCYLFLCLAPYSEKALLVFVLISAFSSVLITKDEFIHTKECSALENWVHSILFVLHPVSFFCAGILWVDGSAFGFLLGQTLLVFVFFLYQVFYWNFYRTPESTQVVDNSIYDAYGERWYHAFDDPVALLRAESKAKTPWVIECIKEFHSKNGSRLKVLDVGCGGGFLSNALAVEGFDVTGVDLSSDSLEVAKRHDETKSVHYQTADAYKLPFPDHAFDVVTAMDFLEHVDHPDQVIEEFSRVLKPNGVFVFHTFNRNLLSGLIIIKFVEWFVKNTPKNMHLLRLFIKPKELALYCLKSGMQMKRMTGIRPVISSIDLKSFFTGVVPESMRFKLTPSTLLSYMGTALKQEL